MLTRLLHACGLYLGSESALMPPQADNPEGFWEHLGFVALNDELLNELGGAWDLPPKPNENFKHPRLDPLRMKARLLIEEFASTSAWGWKDPRNSLTLPFWQGLLPKLKTVIIVRNPLEVAYSMRERNGTSYSFGLRLWEIYNRRVIEAVDEKDRLVTHYDSFFRDAESELRRIVRFVGLPDTEVCKAAALVSGRRRHTHFTIDAVIDTGASAEIIELYRGLIAEASARDKTQMAKAPSARRLKSDEVELLPGSVSRVNGFVPERIAQIEHLYRELLAQAEARHKEQIEELANHLAKTEARHKEQVEELANHLAKTEARHKEQVGELTAHYNREIAQMNQLIHEKSVSLAKSEAQEQKLRNRLGEQLKVTKKLSRLLDEADHAAARLSSSARWQMANPIAALKAKLSPTQARDLLGYGHLEKVVSTYQKWRNTHPQVALIDEQIQVLTSPRPQKALPIQPSVPMRLIEFPVHEQVEVSIIIPVFNQFRFTQGCLASLQEHQGTERFE